MQLVGLVPSDENQLLVHDSVAGGICFGYDDGFRDELVAPESHTTGTAVAASGLDEVTKFGYLSSRIVGLVPSDKNPLRVHDSVAAGMCFGYGNGPTDLYTAEDDFHLLITSGNGARGSKKYM